MTYAITAGAGVLAGSVITAWLLAARFTARAQEAGWRRDWPESTGVVPVPPAVVRRLARQADSAERRARRYELAVAALQELHHDVIGDLLDKVRDRDRRIRRLAAPRHRHRSAWVPYGAPS